MILLCAQGLQSKDVAERLGVHEHILESLMRRRGRFDGILIETTGLADPAPVAQTFLVDEPALVAVEERTRRLNPTATILRSERCDLVIASLLDRILEVEPEFLDKAHDHDHDDHVTSFSLVVSRPIDPEKFFPWIQSTVQSFGVDRLRMKGIVAFEGDDDRYVIQGVHMLLEGDHLEARRGAHAAARLYWLQSAERHRLGWLSLRCGGGVAQRRCFRGALQKGRRSELQDCGTHD